MLTSYMQDVSIGAKLLGALLLTFIVFLFVRFYKGFKKEKQPKKPATFTLDGVSHPVARSDLIPLAIILMVYGAVAFWNLGDTQAPQSFYQFSDENKTVQVDLGGEQEIASILYYTGLYEGNYDIAYSKDGKNWKELPAKPSEKEYIKGVMPQSYMDLFKWQEARMDKDSFTARYIRFKSARQPLELGEVALFDKDGELIAVPDSSNPLFDEQSLIPDEPSWRNSTYFDEIYHGRTAYEHIRNIYPYEISHPPLGKLFLSLGIRAFGMTPFGWRFVGTLFGVLMLIPMFLLLKQLFGKRSVATCGTIIFAFEFMHFTQTRIATIDTYSVLFILLSFLFMWRWISAPYAESFRKNWWNLALSGLFFGVGCACKWTVVYSGAALAALWALRVMLKCYTKGPAKYKREFFATIGLSVAFFLIVPATIYSLSYIPYGLAKGMQFPQMLASSEFRDEIVNNQRYMFSYHSKLKETHPYSSSWYEWLFDLRPVLYFADYNTDSKSIIATFNSPLVSWGGLIAVIATVLVFRRKKNPSVTIIWGGYLCQLVPWILVPRYTFAYHYFGGSVFLVMALCFVFNELISYSKKNARLMYAFAGAQVILFAAFYPVLSGMEAGNWYFTLLKWLPRWPW